MSSGCSVAQPASHMCLNPRSAPLIYSNENEFAVPRTGSQPATVTQCCFYFIYKLLPTYSQRVSGTTSRDGYGAFRFASLANELLQHGCFIIERSMLVSHKLALALEPSDELH